MSQIEKIKNLLYSGQKLNVDLAISIMDSLGLTWDSKGFEQEKELINICWETDEDDVFYRSKVDLGCRHLCSLPASIGQLQSLENLVLYFNELQILPKRICRLQQLKVLDLRSNQIKSIPESIGQLQNLNHLYLSNNQISYLPESIGQLQNLKCLLLGGNPISQSEADKIQTLLPDCKTFF